MEENENTKEMFSKHAEILEAKVFAALREKSGLHNADQKELFSLCNYIGWVYRNGLQLNFTLNAEELAYTEVAMEVPNYKELGVYPEQVYLPVW